ncbi:MAG TPA: type II secretion system protein [Candidatus Saccharimonadales bacterium]|nr:type II secretion system protein [Candidatus Saccharimonadales bacterium]
MKGGHQAQGFTIIETLVVLGVTAALFVAVVATLAGRQGRTQFSQSVQDVKSQIQQVINDVGSGFYPDTNNFTCTAGAAGPNLTPGSSRQGANTGCIFLGKVIQFDVSNTSGNEQLKVYTVAGLQRDTSGREVATYAAARPKAIAPSTISPSTPDASTTGIVKYGLKLEQMKYGAAGADIGAVAFLNSLASYSGSGVDSSSQHVNVLPINGTTKGMTPLAAAQAINNNLAASPINTSSGIRLCFYSATSNQSATITIGGGGRQQSVTVSIRENKSCP